MPDEIATTSGREPFAGTTAAVIAAAQPRLRAGSYHALQNVQCELMNGAMVLSVRVASFYFKQLAQEAARQADGARGSSMSWKLGTGGGRLPTAKSMVSVVSFRKRSKEARRQRMKVRILIVDDHPTVCESLQYVFAAAGIEPIMEATTWQEAINAVQEGDVDLVLLDVALRDDISLDALREIKCLDASVPVLVHSYRDNQRLLSRCFHLGAAGYVVKGNDKNELIRAVRHTAVGKHVWTAEQCARIHQWDAECGNSRTGETSIDGRLTLT